VSLFAAGAVFDPCVVIEVGDSGPLADRLGAAFAQARDAELGESGCVIFHVRGDESERAGVTGLARTLALEWAGRGIRVNVVGGERPEDLIRFVSSPASRMLTGAVLDA
jgi:NAD(P)-dependent dehydrogenase (short-subunit alcohol dehydrogenase family)